MGEGRLRVLSGNMAGDVLRVDGELLLGRGQTGDGDLGGDAELSRRHARIEATGHGHLLIEDLGSTNGTHVNGTRISHPILLNPGDTIKLGASELQVVPASGATLRGARDTQRAAGEPAPAFPPLRPPPPADRPPPPPGPVHPSVERRRWPLGRLLAALVAALVIAAIVVVVLTVTGGGSSNSPSAGATVSASCGRDLGGGEPVGSVAYVESNVANPNANSVIAMPYRAGDLKPLPASQCSTGGSGSADLTDSGVLDADNQVLMNPQQTLLFAVNQGSDSIAVFQVQPDGALKPAPGSPYPSGGSAPASLGLSGNTLVVANKAQDGVRDLSTVKPNYTTFTVSRDGRLTQVPGSNVRAAPGSSPTDAYVPEQGGVAFTTEESGPLRGFSIAPNGVIRQGPNSPLKPDPAIFGPGFDPAKEFGLGIAALAGTPLLYIGMPTVPSVAVYTYRRSGQLNFVNSIPVRGGYLPCWIVITPNLHWMYVANADTNNVAAFDLDNPIAPRQIQTLNFDQAGNTWNMALDRRGRYLFVNSPRDTFKVPPGEGNIQHVLRIRPDGNLTEVSSSPTAIPVPDGVNPQGLAVFTPHE